MIYYHGFNGRKVGKSTGIDSTSRIEQQGFTVFDPSCEEEFSEDDEMDPEVLAVWDDWRYRVWGE
jgi:hypothetical protein